MRKVRTAVLISGRGSNMGALIQATKKMDYPAEISLVISNRPEAGGIAAAAGQGLETAVIDHKAFPSKDAFETALDDRLRASSIELIALAGFMRVLSPSFVSRWEGRIINIHPSLLPAYKGLSTHERALADGAKRHGCSVHFVTAKLDDGPVIEQAEVPVLPSDTPETLAARVLEQEHRIYPEALAKVSRKLQAMTSI